MLLMMNLEFAVAQYASFLAASKKFAPKIGALKRLRLLGAN
jgi:hypothetical protein